VRRGLIAAGAQHDSFKLRSFAARFPPTGNTRGLVLGKLECFMIAALRKAAFWTRPELGRYTMCY
jgi:hypothetical protein